MLGFGVGDTGGKFGSGFTDIGEIVGLKPSSGLSFLDWERVGVYFNYDGYSDFSKILLLREIYILQNSKY